MSNSFSNTPADLNTLYLTIDEIEKTRLKNNTMMTINAMTRIAPENMSPTNLPSKYGINMITTRMDKIKLMISNVLPGIR